MEGKSTEKIKEELSKSMKEEIHYAILIARVLAWVCDCQNTILQVRVRIWSQDNNKYDKFRSQMNSLI